MPVRDYDCGRRRLCHACGSDRRTVCSCVVSAFGVKTLMQSVLTVFSVANSDLQRRSSDRQKMNIRSPYRKVGRPPKVIFGKWRGLRHRVRDPKRANLWTLPIGRGFQSGSCLLRNILGARRLCNATKRRKSSGDLHARRGVSDQAIPGLLCGENFHPPRA